MSGNLHRFRSSEEQPAQSAFNARRGCVETTLNCMMNEIHAGGASPDLRDPKRWSAFGHRNSDFHRVIVAPYDTDFVMFHEIAVRPKLESIGTLKRNSVLKVDSGALEIMLGNFQSELLEVGKRTFLTSPLPDQVVYARSSDKDTYFTAIASGEEYYKYPSRGSCGVTLLGCDVRNRMVEMFHSFNSASSFS